MANVNNPFGAKVIGNFSTGGIDLKVNKYYVPSTDTTALRIGDFVKTNNTATSDGIPIITRAAAGESVRGVIVAFETLRETENTTYRAASTNRVVYVCDDPYVELEMQVNGTLETTHIGKYFNLSVAAGNDVTGLSGTTIDLATASTTSAQVKIISIVERLDNSMGAYAKVLCVIHDHELQHGITGSIENIWKRTGTLIEQYNAGDNVDLGTGTLSWSSGQTVNEIVTSVSGASTNSQLPTAKAVNDAILTKDTFLELNDTPSSYSTAHALYKVNAATDAVVESTMTVDDSGNALITGDLGATGSRITKGWLTDLEITNFPTISGKAINAVSQYTYYVDPTKAASFPTTNGSVESPFATIQEALTAIGNPTSTAEAREPWEINIAPGYYDEDLSLPAGRWIKLISHGAVTLGDSDVPSVPRDVTINIDSTQEYGGLRPFYVFSCNAACQPDTARPAKVTSFNISGDFIITSNAGVQSQADVVLDGVKISGTYQLVDGTTTVGDSRLYAQCCFFDNNTTSITDAAATGGIRINKFFCCETDGAVICQRIEMARFCDFDDDITITAVPAVESKPIGFYSCDFNSHTFTGIASSFIYDAGCQNLPTLAGGATAVLITDSESIAYDNTGSTLVATDVEAALDELDTKIVASDTWDEVMHNGNTFTVLDTENLSATITQNDTTNNPAALIINNTGSGNDITLPNSSSIKNGALAFDSITLTGKRIESVASPATYLAAETISGDETNHPVAGNGGAVTLTSNPQIAAGTNGERKRLIGTSDANPLTVVDGNGLALENGQSFTLGENDIIEFIYYNSLYIETSRVDN